MFDNIAHTGGSSFEFATEDHQVKMAGHFMSVQAVVDVPHVCYNQETTFSTTIGMYGHFGYARTSLNMKGHRRYDQSQTEAMSWKQPSRHVQ